MPSELDDRPYKTYRSGPRGLKERLRGEDALDFSGPGGDGGDGDRGARTPGRRWRWRRGRISPLRAFGWLVGAIVAWLLLSLVLFMISSGQDSSSVSSAAESALSSGPNMLTGTDTVLILGTDQRPTGSKEPGANTSDAGSRSDTIMLWRIGGGVSRRLSIPRDTVAAIPGHGTSKINAAYAYGGAALAIKTISQFTGVPINHVIIVNLAAFPPFIDAIGGVDVTTGRVCSDISGGAKNGGFSLYLQPGQHHLTGTQALVYARTRHNKCNPNDSDLTRVKHQQQILNGVKSQLFSPYAFFHLPWAAWDAPKVLRTDMGGPTLLTLFAASELGGNAPVQVLKPTGATTLPDGESALTVTSSGVRSAVSKLMNG
jgi:LCP family protein required for cell wall assembly